MKVYKLAVPILEKRINSLTELISDLREPNFCECIEAMNDIDPANLAKRHSPQRELNTKVNVFKKLISFQ